MSSANDRYPQPAPLQRIVLGLFASLLWAGGAHAMITVGPASDTACQYHDIAAAVQAAGQAAGPELIAISGGPWTGQTTITDHDSDGLTIEGGFANCSAGISTGRSTLDGQGALPAGPLIVHSGNGPLTLLHLILQNAQGGIQSVVAGHLTLSDVLVYANHADYGGGLFVSGNDIFRMQLTLIGTSINSNSASVNGGGLYLSKVDVSISGGSNILGNLAQGANSDGGGIYAIDSNIVVHDHSFPPSPFIGSNIAQRNGGGVYFSISHAGNYHLLMDDDVATRPLLVADNAAQNQGGAFYFSAVSSGQQIFSFGSFVNVQMQQNEATEGAAIYAFSSGTGAGVGTQIQLQASTPADSIPACTAGVECNVVDDNHAVAGAIIDLHGAGDAGATSLYLSRAHMRHNRGGALIGGNASMFIDSSLLAANEIDQGGDLIYNISNDVHIANSTIAYNTLAGSELFTVILPPASLEILHSLLVQPNDPVAAYSVGSGVPVTLRDIGANNVSGLDSGTNVQNLADPFVNPGQDDFHISITSSAVDRWADSGDPNDPPPTLDLDGATRPHVFNSATTPYDFGAYEAGAIFDVIFANGFD
jgi:hypothetical protein